MKKRLFAGLLAGTMAMSLMAGCGSSSSSSAAADKDTASTSTAAASATTAAASGDAMNMTLIISQRDEFRGSLEEAAKEKAAEYNVNLTTQDANNDTNKLLNYIEACVSAGEDAILVTPVDSETGGAIVDAAQDTPLVFVNIAPDDLSVLGEHTAMICSNETEAGNRQGEFLADYFEAKGQTDIKYIMMQGTLGMIHTEQRTAGCLDKLAELGINAEAASANLCGDYDRATAMDMIAPLLGNTEFDAIICNNDAMALGCVEAIKAAGLNPSDYAIVGVDCTADGAQAVAEGDMAMTVFQDPVGQGGGAMQIAINIINGEEITAHTDYETNPDNEYTVWVPFQTVTADNVADFM